MVCNLHFSHEVSMTDVLRYDENEFSEASKAQSRSATKVLIIFPLNWATNARYLLLRALACFCDLFHGIK